MKNLVPPRAHSKPNVAAMCIQSFLFSGIFMANMPDNSRGIPNREGKKDVIEFESERIEIATPQRISKAPYPMVILGIDWPATVNCSSILLAKRTTL